MTHIQILKKAKAIVAGLIAQKMPDAEATFTAAHKKMGEIVAMSKGLEPGQPVPAPFAQSVAGVIEMMDSFRSGYASNDPAQTVAAETAAETARNAERIGKGAKHLTAEGFAAHVKTTVEKALAAKSNGECLSTLYGLHAAISKAITNVESFAADTTASSFEEVAQFSVGVEVDPLQVIPTDATQSLAADQTAAPAAGSNFAASDTGSAGAVAAAKTSTDGGTIAGNQAAAPAGDSNFEAVGKAFSDLAATVEKSAAKDTEENDIGWTMDLNSEEFLTGRRKVDFGRDRTKPTA